MKNRLTKIFSSTLRGTLRVAKKFIGEAAVLAGYDAVRQTWGERSWLFQSLQDAWLEIDSLTRKELQRIHDSLIENSCVVQKIRNLWLQFSVGPSGLICTPNASRMPGVGENKSADNKGVEAWNHSRAEAWERWWRKPELNSEISGAQLTRVWSGLLFDKGEIFVVLTEEKSANEKGVVTNRTPKIQTIDAHRCETPEGLREYRGNILVDGVEMTREGKIVAYWFRKTNFDAATFGGIPASEAQYDRIEAYDKKGRRKVLHKFKVRRPGQVRGIPEGFSVYNLVRDNMDLHKLEMQAAKLASDIANVETNPTGELDTLANRRAKLAIGTQNASGQPVNKNLFADYKVSVGSKNIALKQGDKLEQFMISRPTIATQQYWDLHYTLICMGYNVPKLLVMPYSLQGTVTRADLEISSFGFGREAFEIISELLREIYEWQTEWAVNYDRTMDGATTPEDYLAVTIRPPRAPNVDVGYNAKALETELKLGVRTIPEVYAEKQQDWRLKLREIAEFHGYLKELQTEFGVAPEVITSLAINELAVKEAKQEGEAKETEEEPEKIAA